MPTEAWRIALARWGDPTWTLAALLTGQAETAQATVVDIFSAAYHSNAPDDPEHTLYHALAHRRVRFDRVRRRPLLSRALRRVAPADRLLLALWLLRDQNGEQLTAITGETLSTLTARLTTAITRWSEPRRAVPGTASPQTDLALLVTQHLTTPTSANIGTRSHGYAMQTTIIDKLRTELHELTHAMHLPAECPGSIEARLRQQEQATGGQWWQRKAFWQLGLVVATIAILLWLVIPRSNLNSERTAAPTTAQALVQTALQRWSATSEQILHRRVWSIDPQQQQKPAIVTDVWLPAGTSAEHRIEVHRGNQLLEWQIANGERRLNYGALPTENACPWTLPSSTERQAALSFRISPDDQRAARDARLQQGAYGLGYLALQRALAAPDLRSFGTRVVASRTFVTLIYSDTYWGPSQQVVLRIDPGTGELYGVQTVSVTGAQTRTRDLWRVDVRENVEFIPSPLPDWSEAKRVDQLLDPSCLVLSADDALDLRTALNAAGTRWYLPPTLPDGLARAAIVAPKAPQADDAVPEQPTVQFTGPGHFLAISPLSWQPDIASTSDIERGKWRIASRPQSGTEPAHMTLHLRHESNAGVFPQLNPGASGWSVEQTLDTYVATIDVIARGWTEDELLAIVDELAPATPATWVQMHDHFVTPHPIDTTVRATLDQAIAAIEPPNVGTIVTTAQTRARTRGALPELADPYHIANDLWAPEATQLRQTLVYGQSGIVRFTDQRTTTNGVPYVSRSSYGTQFIFGNHAQGWVIDGEATQLGAAAFPEQPGIAMLTTMLESSEPITMTEQPGAWLLERTASLSQEDLNGTTQDIWNETPWTANLPAGTITYRLWLDRVTSLPQRLELVHSASGEQTRLQETVITERRVTNTEATVAELAIPAIRDDDLRFRWSASAGPLLDARSPNGAQDNLPFTWTKTSGATMQWHLESVGATQPLAMSAFKAPRWFNLSRLSAVHRTLYRVDADNYMGILVTQGPKNLMQHVIRYSEMSRGADIMPWTTSTRMTVKIDGIDREAWLLAHNEVAALVIDIDDQLVHVMGLRSYIEGPLLPMLSQLTATTP